jgi:hypothetical protein
MNGFLIVGRAMLFSHSANIIALCRLGNGHSGEEPVSGSGFGEPGGGGLWVSLMDGGFSLGGFSGNASRVMGRFFINPGFHFWGSYFFAFV